MQGSRLFVQDCLHQLSTSCYCHHPLQISILENHFELTYSPQHSEPSNLPSTFLKDQTFQNTCKFWGVRFENGLDQRVMEHIVISPIMNCFDEKMKSKIILSACAEGKLTVLKMLGSRSEEGNPVEWITCLVASLHQQSPDSAQTPDLLPVVEYLYNLSPTLFLSTIVRLALTYPRVSLDLINRFRPQGQSEDHFVKSGLGLVSVPAPWVQTSCFTFINISNNLLLKLPEFLFQLATLRGLDVSHNCLDAVPNILKWNCPHLRELNLSFNRLVNTKFYILNQSRSKPSGKIPAGDSPRNPLNEMHFSETKRLCNLTGYNLYPCIHSLNWVNLSNNESLSQVPEWVCILPHLSLLNLEKLPHLTSLTPYLAYCRNLCILKIDVRRLVSPRASDVLHGGTRAIMAYLRCQLRGSTPYRHLKLVLIGSNGVGKSTLFSQLVRLKSHPASLASVTNSHVSFAALDYRGSGDGGGGRGEEDHGRRGRYRPKVTFHLVDLSSGGLTQSAQQCFLTYRTLYLCLWDTTKGIDSLRSLSPWLRRIQASVPGSSILLIGTHIDQRPGLSRHTICQWECEAFGDAVLSSEQPGVSFCMGGYPQVSESVAMNCQNRRDVGKLMETIYRLALHLKHPKTGTLLMEEMVPRSYQELQTLVEVRMRVFQRNNSSPVLQHEQFMDHVRSLTLHHDDLEEDEEEFSLAVRFLHEAGTIVHYKSQLQGANDLYFLSPQWLFSTLKDIMLQMASKSLNAVISSGDLPQIFQLVGIPQHFYNSFLSLMEENNMLVSLDMEKSHFLIPSALPDLAPHEYPTYDFSAEGASYLMQYVQLEYLPDGFFSQLLARILMYVRQLAGQLLTIGSSPLTETEKSNDCFSSKRASVYGTVNHRFHLDQLGYVQENDLVATNTENDLRRKLWALSTLTLSTVPSRYRSLTEKLVTLTRPILQRQSKKRREKVTHKPGGVWEGGDGGGRRDGEMGGGGGDGDSGDSGDGGEGDGSEDESASASKGENQAKNGLNNGSEVNSLDEFSVKSFWKKGLYIEFPCNTSLSCKTAFWLEACEGALAIVVSGDIIPRVKVLSFVTACLDMLLDEYYSGLNVAYYSPCPRCLSRYWCEARGSPSECTDSSEQFTFAESNLEMSGDLSFSVDLNEFSGRALFRRKDNSFSKAPTFSGSDLRIESSLSPTTNGADTADSVTDTQEDTEVLSAAILDNSMVLYSLPSLIALSTRTTSVECSKCETSVPLHEIGPHVLFLDFSNSLLLRPRKLLYGEGERALLGRGGYGKVLKGTYDGHPVAVKMFRRAKGSVSLARQYKNLREELTILSHLDHPRVVKLVGVCLRPLCMVMMMAPQGSLSNHLDLCPLGLEHTVAHRVLYQVADGIRYLHSLYIVHRDIKPGNVLVWSLDPTQDVDVRLADYGISQFSSPSGLWRHKGTEEFMAPELKSSARVTYDEKVDIFSFSLLLHLVMTGRKLFAGIVNRRDQLRMIYHADIPQLSQALAKSVEENRPQLPDGPFHYLLTKDGTHPAARRNLDSSCHSVCMQGLMQDCLSQNPARRPSAQGVCSSLLTCRGGLKQSRFFIPSPISLVAHSPATNHILGMTEGESIALVVIYGAWLYRMKGLPYDGESISCMGVIGKEVFMGSATTNLIFSIQLPQLTSGHIAENLLPGAPLCIITQEMGQDTKVIVGMSAARIAIFSSLVRGRHLLETQPYITQVISQPDAHKTDVRCGIFYKGMVWCGCGRNLMGLDPNCYNVRHLKPVLKGATDGIARIVGALGRLWMSSEGSSELVIVEAKTLQCMEPINCHLILGMSSSSTEAIVSDVASSGEAIWVGTNGGHIITFDPVSADVLLISQQYSHVSAVVVLATEQVVVFGTERVEGVEEDEEKPMFAVWDSYVRYRIS